MKFSKKNNQHHHRNLVPKSITFDYGKRFANSPLLMKNIVDFYSYILPLTVSGATAENGSIVCSTDFAEKFIKWNSISVLKNVYHICKSEILCKEKDDIMTQCGPFDLLIAAAEQETVLPQMKLRGDRSAYKLHNFLKENSTPALWDAHESHNFALACDIIRQLSYEQKQSFVTKYEMGAKGDILKMENAKERYNDHLERTRKLLEENSSVISSIAVFRKRLEDQIADFAIVDDFCKSQNRLRFLANTLRMEKKKECRLRVELEIAEQKLLFYMG